MRYRLWNAIQFRAKFHAPGKWRLALEAADFEFEAVRPRAVLVAIHRILPYNKVH